MESHGRMEEEVTERIERLQLKVKTLKNRVQIAEGKKISQIEIISIDSNERPEVVKVLGYGINLKKLISINSNAIYLEGSVIELNKGESEEILDLLQYIPLKNWRKLNKPGKEPTNKEESANICLCGIDTQKDYSEYNFFVINKLQEFMEEIEIHENSKMDLNFTEVGIIHLLRNCRAANSQDPLWCLLRGLTDYLKLSMNHVEQISLDPQKFSSFAEDLLPYGINEQVIYANPHLAEHCQQLLKVLSPEHA